MLELLQSCAALLLKVITVFAMIMCSIGAASDRAAMANAVIVCHMAFDISVYNVGYMLDNTPECFAGAQFS